MAAPRNGGVVFRRRQHALVPLVGDPHAQESVGLRDGADDGELRGCVPPLDVVLSEALVAEDALVVLPEHVIDARSRRRAILGQRDGDGRLVLAHDGNAFAQRDAGVRHQRDVAGAARPRRRRRRRRTGRFFGRRSAVVVVRQQPPEVEAFVNLDLVVLAAQHAVSLPLLLRHLVLSPAEPSAFLVVDAEMVAFVLGGVVDLQDPILVVDGALHPDPLDAVPQLVPEVDILRLDPYMEKNRDSTRFLSSERVPVKTTIDIRGS